MSGCPAEAIVVYLLIRNPKFIPSHDWYAGPLDLEVGII
jgi:hypothetical protein